METVSTNSEIPVTPQAPSPTQEEAMQFHRGFQRVEAAVRAVREEQLESIQLDVPSTVATVLGAVHEMAAFRSALSGLVTFDVSQIDNLQDYALALGHTHSTYRASGGTVDNIGELAAECLDLRDRFHADATALAKRRLLDEARVSKLRGGNSYRMIAFDIDGLAGVFLESWETIQGRTALEVTEIEDARLKANQLIAAVGRREQATPVVNKATLLRQQAYTLLVRAYSDTREAIAFLRRAQGDVDKIAPSLFAGRGRRAETVSPEAVSPSLTPSPSPDPEPAAAAVPVGFPGDSPFID